MEVIQHYFFVYQHRIAQFLDVDFLIDDMSAFDTAGTKNYRGNACLVIIDPCFGVPVHDARHRIDQSTHALEERIGVIEPVWCFPRLLCSVALRSVNEAIVSL